MSVFVVGLTGGIGTGKTAVSDRFESRGITIADSDVAARKVVEPGEPALEEIRAHFGEGVMDHGGRLDRATLRQRIFSNPDERRWLESLTHPLIMKELRTILANAESDYAVLVLSAAGRRSPLIDRMLVVDAPRELQIERVMARDHNTREQVMAIIKAQPSRETRIERADDVIVNDSDPGKLDSTVEALHRKYLELAKGAA